MKKRTMTIGISSAIFVLLIAGVLWKLKPERYSNQTHAHNVQMDTLTKSSGGEPNNILTNTTTFNADQDTQRLRELEQTMARDVFCITDAQNSCGLPQNPNDPKAAYYEAVSRLQATLKEIMQIGQRNPQLAEKVQAIARNYLLFEDTQVQEVALDILQQYPPSSENFKILKRVALESANSHQTMYTMQSLARYNSPQEIAQVTPVFMEVIQYGAFEAADRAAYEIYPFITTHNIDQYESLLRQLDPEMERTRRLNDTLQKWKSEHQGTPIDKSHG